MSRRKPRRKNNPPEDWRPGLEDAIEAALADPDAFRDDLIDGRFGWSSECPAGRLCDTFRKGRRDAKRTSEEELEAIWDRMIELVRDLAYQHGQTAGAFVLLANLYGWESSTNEYGPSVLRSCAEEIWHDHNEGELEAGPGVHPKFVQRMADRVGTMMVFMEDVELGTSLASEWSGELAGKILWWRRRRYGGPPSLAVIGLVIFLLAGITPESLGLGGWLAGATEDLPPATTGALLGRDEVRYCVNQKIRLTLAGRERLGPVEKSFLNLAITDYNHRCADFRAAPGDLLALRKEAAGSQERLGAQARGWVEEWRELARQQPPALRQADPIQTGEQRLDPRERKDAELIQKRLADLGFYVKPVDGAWGKGSRAALAAFKRANGMGGSTTWDTATQRRLMQSR